MTLFSFVFVSFCDGVVSARVVVKFPGGSEIGQLSIVLSSWFHRFRQPDKFLTLQEMIDRSFRKTSSAHCLASLPNAQQPYFATCTCIPSALLIQNIASPFLLNHQLLGYKHSSFREAIDNWQYFLGQTKPEFWVTLISIEAEPATRRGRSIRCGDHSMWRVGLPYQHSIGSLSTTATRSVHLVGLHGHRSRTRHGTTTF